MKTLPLLLLSFWYCYGTVVVNVQNIHTLKDEEASLSFDNNIEISSVFTVCLRLNIKGYLTDQFIFGSNNGNLDLFIGFRIKIGYIELNQQTEVFKIPNDVFHLYTWNHFCLSLDEEIMTIIANGQICH